MSGVRHRAAARRAALAAALLLPAGGAMALGLVQAYRAALQNDASYRAAGHEREAGGEALALGRSTLLPSASLSYAASKNQAERSSGTLSSHPDYNSAAATLTVRQPLLNLEGMARYRQGQAQARAGAAQFDASGADLIVRVAASYLGALLAEDQLALATLQRDYLQQQSRANEHLLRNGEGTRTDLLETQARLDLAEAQLIEARDNLYLARAGLAAMVGADPGALDGLAPQPRPDPAERPFEEWQALALERNADVEAQRQHVAAAQAEIERTRAGHAPRLDLVAGYSNNKAESVSTYEQRTTARYVGLQLTVPLYAGGAVDAQSRQAVANHQRAQAELLGTTDKVLLELRKQHRLGQSGLARIAALERAVDSARLLLAATRKSVAGGVRVNLDVLNAEQQLLAARRDLAQARYNYLLSYLRLRAAAGTLGADDVEHVAGHLGAAP